MRVQDEVQFVGLANVDEPIRHPQMRPGESFWSNYKDDEDGRKLYEAGDPPGRRRVDEAYDKRGKFLPGYFAVFWKKEEK